MQEREFFAVRESEIANAVTADARAKLISRLEHAAVGSRDHFLYIELQSARRIAEASSLYSRASGRFPLTARGDINTYALFSELFTTLIESRGRAGIVVPTGIATDGTTAPFFADLISSSRLIQLLDFENKNAIFLNVHRSFRFCLLTVGNGRSDARFAFFLTFGSIEKGKELATGAGKRTVACRVCHGDDLKGLGPVPGIAGRSPSYMARQLYDMQQGTRNGTWTELMKPVVTNMNPEDLLDIVAYVSSLQP